MDSLLENLMKCIKSKEQQNCIEILKQLALFDEFDININIPGITYYHSSIFLKCCYEGLIDVIKFFAEHHPKNFNILSRGYKGNTCLHYASARGHNEVVVYLIECAHINPNILNDNKFSILHTTSSNGHYDLVRYLIENINMNPNQQSNIYRFTALHCASREGHLKIVRYLVEHANADPLMITNFQGNSALHLASENGHKEICCYLIDCAKVDRNIRDDYGNTALHSATYFGNVDIIRYLVTHLYYDVNDQNESRQTVLTIAARNAQSAILRYLVELNNVNVNIQDDMGFTALHNLFFFYSFKNNDRLMKCVEVLLKSNRLDTSLRDREGRTAEELAKSLGHHEIADLIANYEPTISVIDHK